MYRALPLCAVILALSTTLPAENPAKKNEAPAKTTIALNVAPMAEPRPALRYTLLPELKDMNPGNPIMAYSKCFAEQNNFYFSKSANEDRQKWLGMQLEHLLSEKLTPDYGGPSLRLADYAARLDTPDWQLLLKLESEGVDMLLPDLVQMRHLAGVLKIRFRAEVAARRFDAAIHTAQTLFALSRHHGEHPTLIGESVGLALAHLCFRNLEEMLEQPGCPNLYWALTDLPTPFIDLRKGLQSERVMLAKEFALFDPATALDPARIRRVLARLDRLPSRWDSLAPVSEYKPPSKPSVVLVEHAKDAARVRAARERVVAAGLPEARAKALPAIQILLLDAKDAYDVRYDDEAKWANVPWPKADAAYAKLGKPDGVFGHLLPNAYLLVRARVRIDQRFALLRHVEAVRLYAASHGGKPPPRLDDIDVPLPDDPVTGKPFLYNVEGKTAIITGTAPRGMEKVPAGIEYRVTIR